MKLPILSLNHSRALIITKFLKVLGWDKLKELYAEIKTIKGIKGIFVSEKEVRK